MDNRVKVGSTGLSLSTIVFVIFLILKLTGIIDWAWVWVFAPLWIMAAIWFSVVVLITVILFLIALIRRK